MNLYETDWHAWVQEQATLLEQGRFDALDVGHLVEELELMAGSARGELVNRLIVLLTHLVKLHVAAQHLPMDLHRAGRGWRQTCRTQRVRLGQVLRRNPSLRHGLPADVQEAYEVAVLEAAQALGLEELPMPSQCPWTLEQVLDADFWPEGEPTP
jgi:hypothetical protein